MSTHSPGRRRFWLFAAALVLGLFIYAFLGFGRFLAREDPLQRADVIFVLAGTRIERPLEGADLFREGWAPLIVLTHQKPEPASAVLIQRGARVPSDEDLARDALIQTGIPASAVVIPEPIHDNTAQEGGTLRALARRNGWRTVIVVTSKYHLRRAGFAIRRELADTGVNVVMRGSRYDPSQPDRWWASRADVRWMMSEGPKFFAYLLGLGA